MSTGFVVMGFIDKKCLEFAEDPRSLMLGLAANGFNPFCNLNLPIVIGKK